MKGKRLCIVLTPKPGDGIEHAQEFHAGDPATRIFLSEGWHVFRYYWRDSDQPQYVYSQPVSQSEDW